MEHIQFAALQKAMALLSASGAQFAIIDADGKQYGGLELAKPKAPKIQRKRTQKNKFQEKYRYLDTVKALPVGGVAKFVVTKDESKAFHSALAGSGGRFFGPGNYMTAKNGLSIEIMRVV